MIYIQRVLTSLLLTFTVLSYVPGVSSGGGILHVFPPSLQDESIAVARPAVLLSRSVVTVSESYAEYRIEQTFFNDNDFPLSGVFLLPMNDYERPETIDIRMDGVPYPSEIMSPETFFPVLRELTTSMKDPSLMGLAGRTVVVVRPVQIGVRGQRSVKCQFRLPVAIEKDLLDIHLPLDGERYSLAPVGELDIRVRMKMDRPVRSVFSPTHNLTITRETSHRCLAFAKSVGKKVRDGFQLISSFSGQDPDLQILTHKMPGKKGTFMALVSPPLDLTKNKEPEKDVVFVLDSSKSMGPSEFALAKRAIVSGLQRLGPGDRFNVFVIDTRPRSMSDRLVAISDESVAQAARFVDSVQEGGGTDLYNALVNSLEQFTSRKRLPVVVLVGNGRGTVGITNPETIIEDVQRSNRFRARIFTLGLGRHMDIALLDSIAASSKGGSLHHLGKEDFETLLNRFYSGVTPPQVSEISLEFQDISPEEVEPDPIPDQLGTGSVVVLGRYGEIRDTPCRVRLKARIQGRPRTVTSAVTFPEVDRSNSFLPGLWAMRRVAKLLEKEWLKGPESEHRGRLPMLAKEFGFKLPPQTVQFGGPQQRHSSDLLWRFKTSFSRSDVEADGFRALDGKVMRLSPNGVWIDLDYHASMETRVIEFLSNEYFSIVRNSPRLGVFMSIGTDLILAREKEALRVKSDRGPATP
ncbi:MAG: VWA domain-containing protein [Desulfomonile tiedjei]|uniref:VWA domain-containing protein n=1 Tax=Desulfomonile tiedjei TaxID=2358 RepID=A0A9D6V8M3_9BACT|nr:VWA domain-containing protein [Desulfomonile tiedjei]